MRPGGAVSILREEENDMAQSGLDVSVRHCDLASDGWRS